MQCEVAFVVNCLTVVLARRTGKQLFYQVPQHMLSSAGLHVSELKVGAALPVGRLHSKAADHVLPHGTSLPFGSVAAMSLWVWTFL